MAFFTICYYTKSKWQSTIGKTAVKIRPVLQSHWLSTIGKTAVKVRSVLQSQWMSAIEKTAVGVRPVLHQVNDQLQQERVLSR